MAARERYVLTTFQLTVYACRSNRQLPLAPSLPFPNGDEPHRRFYHRPPPFFASLAPLDAPRRAAAHPVRRLPAHIEPHNRYTPSHHRRLASHRHRLGTHELLVEHACLVAVPHERRSLGRRHYATSRTGPLHSPRHPPRRARSNPTPGQYSRPHYLSRPTAQSTSPLRPPPGHLPLLPFLSLRLLAPK